MDFVAELEVVIFGACWCKQLQVGTEFISLLLSRNTTNIAEAVHMTAAARVTCSKDAMVVVGP